METITTNLGPGVSYTIIPEIQTDPGTAIKLSYVYGIYRDKSENAPEWDEEAYVIPREKAVDDSYRGHITIEEPGNIFVYKPGDGIALTAADLQELIEVICHYQHHYHFSEMN